jgi:hypothetical protein
MLRGRAVARVRRVRVRRVEGYIFGGGEEWLFRLRKRRGVERVTRGNQTR